MSTPDHLQDDEHLQQLETADLRDFSGPSDVLDTMHELATALRALRKRLTDTAVKLEGQDAFPPMPREHVAAVIRHLLAGP